MRTPLVARWVSAVLLALTAALPAAALGDEVGDGIRATLALSTRSLARRARAALERKYPDEDWGAYGFPRYVFTNEPTTTAYRIAVKEPATLVAATCACFCDEMGHTTLTHCFLKDGRPTSGFDDHAAGCNICVRQALLAFLWAELGADHAEIRQAMRDAFGAP
ncbi:MAG: hypothetical protein Kow0092_06720 [Deferrisomatales bacterium]